MKDKIVKGVWLAANFNAASVKYLEKDKASDGAEVFKLGQTEYLKADDVLSAVMLLREKQCVSFKRKEILCKLAGRKR